MSNAVFSSPIQPIKLRSLRDHVHDQLRSAIIAGKLRTGEKLNERQLAAQFGISTSPLKEALRQLEGEGLVHTEARRGTYVTFSARQAEEMTLARAALESIIARQAAKHGSDADFSFLSNAIVQMQQAVDAGDIDALVELNESFHDGIHSASGCTYLCRLQNAQRMYDHAARITVLSSPEVREQSFCEHRDIMAAITSRNEDLAERLMREHILKAGQTHIELVF
ncbi:GntR family transcriptional regulator [Kerstersia gyiorum]|uniref:GntR family transcriptional regulator n=1 Tax=Kerstersia gyiorum TaxID=206506 RepID=A0A4V2F1I6_9BURK|nr:GntR family transcriptional regulator [Kerstersia gyiorum]MCO7642307.1 GntR family transcriptional regulator [Pseudomonas sp. S 311-6]MCP1632544.1 DNA-binding GntR family transcriptional regulator [Kerstersia gyiorum]MCP1634950.1 DNA-binding GntR family transcriptional regulator [Kerstersia gyiorum]MCP1670122.1 DNA-binding GntR family transcriptional regulator [Kerstersia gyiorum]MCP1678263.1 DNA-binding GntR family transcriptional regulator [Kerstersia gyiorum]